MIGAATFTFAALSSFATNASTATAIAHLGSDAARRFCSAVICFACPAPLHPEHTNAQCTACQLAGICSGAGYIAHTKWCQRSHSVHCT